MVANLYVRLDASYHEDERVLLAGEKAELLYIRSLCLAKRILSDGFIADVHLPRFGLSSVAARARKLVEVGLWRRDEDRGGYWITAWDKWNRSAADIEGDSSREGARGNHVRWHVNRGIVEEDCEWCSSTSPPTDVDASGGDIAPDSPPDIAPDSASGSPERTERDRENPPTPAADAAGVHRLSPRANGTNPRALGTNPRSVSKREGRKRAAAQYGANLASAGARAPQARDAIESHFDDHELRQTAWEAFAAHSAEVGT